MSTNTVGGDSENQKKQETSNSQEDPSISNPTSGDGRASRKKQETSNSQEDPSMSTNTAGGGSENQKKQETSNSQEDTSMSNATSVDGRASRKKQETSNSQEDPSMSSSATNASISDNDSDCEEEVNHKGGTLQNKEECGALDWKILISSVVFFVVVAVTTYLLTKENPSYETVEHTDSSHQASLKELKDDYKALKNNFFSLEGKFMRSQKVNARLRSEISKCATYPERISGVEFLAERLKQNAVKMDKLQEAMKREKAKEGDLRKKILDINAKTDSSLNRQEDIERKFENERRKIEDTVTYLDNQVKQIAWRTETTGKKRLSYLRNEMINMQNSKDTEFQAKLLKLEKDQDLVLLVTILCMVLLLVFGFGLAQLLPNSSKDQNRLLNTKPSPQHVAARVQFDLCIVTFNSQTYKKMKTDVKLVRKIVESKEVPHMSVDDFLVKGYEDLQYLTHAQKYIVVVDKNDRDVVLENTSMGQGALRVGFVREILQRKGDLCLVYYGDRASRHLEGTFYNTSLGSVRQVKELEQLASRGHFISIDDHFNEEQEFHLLQWLLQKK